MPLLRDRIAITLLVSLAVAVSSIFAVGLFLPRESRSITRTLPVLNVFVEVDAPLPEGVRVSGDFGRHCGDYIREGTIDGFYPMPQDAVAALYVDVVRASGGVSSWGETDPFLIYMTKASLNLSRRLLPSQGLFDVRLEADGFRLPSGVLLQEGGRSTFSATYTWSDGEVSFEVTETFTFVNAGLMPIRTPRSLGACA